MNFFLILIFYVFFCLKYDLVVCPRKIKIKFLTVLVAFIFLAPLIKSILSWASIVWTVWSKAYFFRIFLL